MRGCFAGWLRFSTVVVVAVVFGPAMVSRAQFFDPAAVPKTSAFSIPQDHLIQAEELNRMLQGSGTKPLVFQVGSHVMFSQAHVRGAQYAGPGSQAAGLQLLESKVAGLAKGTPIVLYCGCCPWNHCPNVAAAFHRLEELGYTHVMVVHLANNFGDDWVQKGYSVETGG